MARTTNKAESLLTFSRASSGTALTKVAYGPELVTNGGFDDGAGWTTLQAGWTISGGTLNILNSYNRAGYPVGIGAFEVGKAYVITGTISNYTSGWVRVYLANSGNPIVASTSLPNANGDFSVVLAPTASVSEIGFEGQTALGSRSIDNVSVKEVLYNDPTGTLKLINHPTNKPRVEYDSNGVAKGLLIEEARTNLIPYSDFSSGWGNIESTTILNQAIAPDGTNTAALVRPSTVNSQHNIYINPSFSYPATASIYAKAAGYNYLIISANGSQLTQFVGFVFDLQNGTVSDLNSSVLTATATASIENVGNGWYRCSFMAETINTSFFPRYQVSETGIVSSNGGGSEVFVGDGTSGIYVWGPQFEQGSFPTSYIPTSGATATRSADLASVSVSEFGYNQAQGSVVVEYAPIYPYNAPNILQVDNNTTGNRIYWQMTGANPSDLTIGSVGASTTLLITHADVFDDSDNVKIATGWAVNDVASSVGGSAVLTDNTFSGLSADVTRITIGHLPPAGIAQCNGHIKSIKYYPVRLDDDKLKELTL